MCEPEIREHGDVAAQGRGVAADEDQAGGTSRRESRRRLAAEAWARRDRRRRRGRAPGSKPRPSARSTRTAVPRLSRASRTAGPFRSTATTLRSSPSKPAKTPTPQYASTNVPCSSSSTNAVADRREDRLGTIGTGLEERGRRDREPTTTDRLVEACSAAALHLVLPYDHDIGRHIHAPCGGRRERKALPRSHPATQRHLARVAVAAVLDEVGEQWMRDEAPVDVDEVVTAIARGSRPAHC